MLDYSLIDMYHREAEFAKFWITLIDRCHSEAEFTKCWFTLSLIRIIVSKYWITLSFKQNSPSIGILDFIEAKFTKYWPTLSFRGIPARLNSPSVGLLC